MRSIARAVPFDEVEVLPHRVGVSLVPGVGLGGLLGRQDVDEAGREAVDLALRRRGQGVAKPPSILGPPMLVMRRLSTGPSCFARAPDGCS